MKRLALLLSLALGLALAPEAHAQRTLPGMRGLEVRAGMADGWYSASGRSTTGYYFGAAMNRYAGRANKWVFGAEYLCRKGKWQRCSGFPDRIFRESKRGR